MNSLLNPFFGELVGRRLVVGEQIVKRDDQRQ